MPFLLGTIATAAGAFTATNLDALVLLIVLFAKSRADGKRAWRVILGQFVVFAFLIVVSGALAATLGLVSLRWTGLLGVVPVLLGLRGLWLAHRADDTEPTVGDSLASIITLTLSVCADNLSVYIVVFRTQPVAQSALTVAVFAVLEVLWCAIGYLTATRKTITHLLRRIGRWLVPALFLAIGTTILVRYAI
ncbi:cadmium transporter [Amycolatopsis sp. K13G38]|uniref:Cadmium transporter n=1 Tax=Amycolatopsis acididurans TaxID=2724524 RepID=A0ABX1JI75_9PSEU|nr:cadmium resistance transporter [Amycolatopsis acididurans]NKQ58539.1 cadmium transporter [Amycolatopsis acididurans]